MGIKDIRRSFILERTIRLFCASSIAEVKIKDVAAACSIGEATFYRYFSKKSGLIVACAMKLQEKVEKYFSIDCDGNGFEKLSRFYYRFFEIFAEHQEYYRFLPTCSTWPRQTFSRAKAPSRRSRRFCLWSPFSRSSITRSK